MSNYWSDFKKYGQPDTEKLKDNIGKTRKKALKKGTSLEPVIINSRSIANSWWGKAWCDNLERYADYGTRLPRGKRYVRTGTVVDLKIEKGKISARVQGSRKTPYKVEIRISPLSEEKCQAIIKKSSSKIESLEKLMDGAFPEELKTLFMEKDGLFPIPREISFNCSCPDWALMCKHVAAALYGVGARLDNDPLMFFELRGIDVEHFISVTLDNKVNSMLENANKPSERIITDKNIIDVFGVL